MKAAHLYALFLSLLVSTAAHCTIIEVDWTKDNSKLEEFSVPAGKVMEICSAVPKGKLIVWNWAATEPISFNIHYHEGKKAHYAMKPETDRSTKGRFHSNSDQTYCWTWENSRSTSVEVVVSLVRGW
jgi:hypothetical protein